MPKETLILPDFIIIGANKAGTTSLANYLTQHPEIKMSDVKEPMFFSSDPHRKSASKTNATLASPYFACTLQEYSSMFSNHSSQTRFFGEASTSYLANPKTSARLIKKITPNTKIIAILREPASRAVSAYKMCHGNNIETRPFSEIVSGIDSQGEILDNHGVKEYIRNGLYSQLISPYIFHFERENLLFLKYDDFDNSPDSTMHRVINFIGASPFDFKTQERHNTEFDHINNPLEILSRDVQKLKEFYQEDIKKTQSQTSLDLSNWTI